MNTKPTAWTRILVAHAVVVGLLVGPFLALDMTTPAGAGADIGAGGVGMLLLLLGLPWSLAVLIDPYWFDGVSNAAWYAAVIGPAALNVALHTATRRILTRRRA